MKTRATPTPEVNWIEVEHHILAFEEAQERTPSADIAAFCPPADSPLFLPVLEELVRVDLEFHWRTKRSKRLADYQTRFPILFEEPDRLAEIAFEEYRLRLQSGEPVSPQEYQDRYGIRTLGWSELSVIQPSVPQNTKITSTQIVEGVGTQAQVVAHQAFAHLEEYPQAGQYLLGFRIHRELGRGAFARVYQAEQSDLANRFVVLKISTQLEEESQTLARLQHTNIVPIYSVHRLGSFHAVCMPYFGATTLADVLIRFHQQKSVPLSGHGFASTVQDRKPTSTVIQPDVPAMPTTPETVTPPTIQTPLDHLRSMTHVEAVLWIGSELAAGLAHAHQRGILHRDLKPANVLLSDEGRPMLLDFNLAANTNESQKTSVEIVGGTPLYMAPEHLAAVAGERAKIDVRSDLYSLGLILYELWTGRFPFPIPKGTSQERMRQLRADRANFVPPARTINPAVPAGIDAILTKCLHPHPSERYNSAADLQEDLTRQLQHRSLLHAQEPLRERWRKTMRRNPWLKSIPFLAFLGAMLLSLGYSAYWYRTRQFQQAEAQNVWTEFQSRSKTAQLLFHVANPEEPEIQEALKQIGSALALYQLPEQEDWQTSHFFARLEPEQQKHLRLEAGKLMFHAAGLEQLRGMRATQPEQKTAALQRAYLWNRQATDLFHGEDWFGLAQMQKAELLDLEEKKEQAKQLRSAIGELPERTETLFYHVAEALNQNQFRKALDRLQSAKRDTLGRSDYWYCKGRCHAELGEIDQAIASYTTALALQPDDLYHPLVRRAEMYLKKQQYALAITDYEEGIRLRPDVLENYLNRAMARMWSKDYTGAIGDLDYVQQEWPTHTRVFFMRSEVHLRAGDRAKARHDQEAGLKQTPGDEVSWIARGMAKQARDAKGALADFEEALKLNPRSLRALNNKATILSERFGQGKEAIAILDQVIEWYPEYTNARTGRGVLLARHGQRDTALNDAREILARNPTPLMRYQVACIYALTSRTHPEDRKEALRWLADALRDGMGLKEAGNDPDLDPIRKDSLFRDLISASSLIQSLIIPKK